MGRVALVALLLLAAGNALGEPPHQNRIAFTRAGPAFMGLFLSDADGTNEHALIPATGLDYNPSFSADRTWIVFTSERAGSADLYRMHADGSGLERLTDSPNYDDQGALSPDGKTVAFVSTRNGGRANLWLLDVARRSVRRVTRSHSGDFRPSWSPDGKWLAFTSDRDEPHRRREPSWELLHFTAVYVVRPDGSGLRRLTPLAEFDHTPTWASDGLHITYTSRPDLQTKAQTVSIDLRTGSRAADVQEHSGDGKSRVTAKGVNASAYAATAISPAFSIDPKFALFRTGTFPASSPDGRQILVSGGFGNSQNTLKVFGPDGANPRTVFEGPKGTWVISPSWAPDAQTIAFSMGSFFDRPVKPGQVALVDASGSNLRMLTAADVSSGFPSFSPDGKHLVYRVLGSAEQGLRILSIEDGAIERLTNGPDNFPAWSPRGDEIVFTSFKTGDFEIYTIRPDGTGLRQLTRDHGNDAHASFAPDGKWIVFTSSRMGWKDEGYGADQAYGEIFVMRGDGSGLHQLTDNQWEDATPAWLR